MAGSPSAKAAHLAPIGVERVIGHPAEQKIGSVKAVAQAVTAPTPAPSGQAKRRAPAYLTPGKSVQRAGSVLTRLHPPETAKNNLHAKCVAFTVAKCRPP